MVEGDALEAERDAGAEIGELTPGHRRGDIVARFERGEIGRLAQVWDRDDALERGDLGRDLGDGLAPVEVLAPVAVAVDGEEDLGLDLGEAVDDAGGAEVGRAGGPDRAEAGGRE